ncbi:hypothetical protein PWT90_08403 [Aphanocladium album]|nr:hypothetical protein PWT90_08403 [Aphanocladium album]
MLQSRTKHNRQTSNKFLSQTQSMHPSQESTPPPKTGRNPKASNPHRPVSGAQCLLTPRPYEEIYHERAYLTTNLEQKTKRIDGLIREYSETEAQLNAGAEGKTRRKLRKLLHLLRCKLDEASEQERAIFSRMGELYMELNSRDAWETTRVKRSSAQPAASRAETAGEDHVATTPVTPCPSFASSEWSVASTSALASPVSVSNSSFSDAQFRRCSDASVVPRSVASEYLETVPEEAEAGTKTPLSVVGEEQRKDVAPSWHPLNQEPEFGDLQYDYVQYDVSEDEAHGSEDDAVDVTPKARVNRFSLPVMQFSWPDA